MALVADLLTKWSLSGSGVGNAQIFYQDNNLQVDRIEIDQQQATAPVRLIALWNNTIIFDRTFQPGALHTLLPGTDFPSNARYDTNKLAKQGSFGVGYTFPA